MQLINDHDAARIETHLGGVIDRHLEAPGLAPLRTMVRDYVLAGGKRIRPQLVAWTHRLAAGESGLNDAVLDVAAGWELFHAFLLVHDDIIDGSHRRRDRPALHYQLASLDSNCIRFGTNLGIVAGDLLFSAAMCLWHGLELEDAAVHRDLLRLFSRIACTTGFGQAIDICASHASLDSLDQKTLLREYQWKTAAYTFEGPMLSGAILAGLGAPERAAISRFALSLGQAYQLQNDINDLAAPAHAGCDLVQGKRTLVLLQHREQLDPIARAIFDDRLTEITKACDDAVMLAELLRMELVGDENALCDSRKLIDSLLREASAAAADPALSKRLAAGLGQLLEGLARKYFVSPFAEVLCL